jgi:hypothetical protein
MATYEGSPFGNLSGKIGSAVASRWKGIPTVKGYVIPANPNTDAQQAQRSAMSSAVAFAKQFLTTIINVFVDPFVTGMSGYNAVVKANIGFLAPEDLLYENCQLAMGNLQTALCGNPIYNAQTGIVTIPFSTGTLGGGLNSDKVIAAVFDIANQVGFVNTTGVLRSTGTIDVAVGSGRDAAQMMAYTFATRYDCTALTSVSNTTANGVGV